MWGPLPISMVLRSEGSPGRLLVNLVPMLEQKKQKKQNKEDGKYNINIRVAGEVVWLR